MTSGLSLAQRPGLAKVVPLDATLRDRALRELRKRDLEDFARRLTRRLGWALEDVLGARRVKSLVLVRHELRFVLWCSTGMSFLELASCTGCLDHTSARASCVTWERVLRARLDSTEGDHHERT